MKTLSRLFSFGVLLTGLCFTSLNATTYTLSGTFTSGSSQSWSVSTPASTSISGSISLSTHTPNATLFGVIQLAPTGGGAAVYTLTASGTGTASNSSSASGIAAGNYNLGEFFYSPNTPLAIVTGTLSATVTW